ncbi:MAG: polysaccharide biosynthesis tyrosine autokinase [Paludibacteraceae bacterium]|nr:polysaccharide biosynthesis tyrosine autokinase [Paludibacteraceae bacterium]
MDNNQTYVNGNNAYYAGGNNAYYSGNNAYYQGNRQYYGNQQYADPQQDQDDNGGFNFDPIEWLLTFLHYWYLFVIGLAIAMGLAMLKNRKWIPTYYSQGTIIIKESGAYGSGAGMLMQGFGIESGYKNVNNQMVMLGSYDLMSRVVDSLPFMSVEYFTQGRFKTRNLYRQSPIVVEPTRLSSQAYNSTYQVEFLKNGQVRLTEAGDNSILDMTVHYGQPISCDQFEITIMPTEYMLESGKIFFRFRTHESLVNEFMGRLQLSFVSQGSTVLALSMVSETPQRDCEFIDKLAEIYLLQNLEHKNEVADNSIRFINEQLKNIQSSLQISEGAMTDFRQENKFVDVNTYAGQLMGRVSSYDQQQMALRLRETYFDYLINYLHTNIESGAVVAPTSLGVEEPMLLSLVQQLNDLRIKRGELTEKNVYYAKYTKDIENVKSAIEEVVNSMRASLEIEKADLSKRYAEVEREIRKLPAKELQMVAIERNYRIDDNYYTFFLQKRAEAEIQKASNTPDNSIMDKARTTAVMNSKAKQKTTSTYLVVGFLIPLLLIVLSELLNNKIRSPKEVNRLRLFHLIGTLRHAKSQNPTLVRSSPRSSYAEMLRAIRTRIEFLMSRKEDMLICVTSTESGDGKTFLSTNLASLYAMTGKKTLLIDLDLRKPNIHTKLGLDNGKGMSNYLVGDCEWEEALETNTQFGFDFVRAGTIPPNPGELVHSDKLTELLKKLREEYKYVILDTSPIGIVPDAYALIEQCDLCMFVIRCMQTNKSFCRQTLEQMNEVVDNPDKIQLVLSDVPTEGRHSYGSGYGYGYGGYGGYGYGHLGYGGYGDYGYGYGENSNAKRYGKLYGKLYGKFTSESKAYQAYHYYHSDEDDDNINPMENASPNEES